MKYFLNGMKKNKNTLCQEYEKWKCPYPFPLMHSELELNILRWVIEYGLGRVAAPNAMIL